MNERRRILYVNHVSRMSGAERSLVDLLRGLDRSRFEPVAAIPGPGELADELARCDVPCHHLPLRRLHKTFNPVRLAGGLLHAVGVSRALAGLIRRERIALVHANSNTAQVYAGPAARQAGVPCVWHTRDLVDLGPLGPWLARRASVIVAISECVRRQVAGYGRDPGLIKVIRHGVAPAVPQEAEVRAAVRTGFGVPEGAPLVGTIGQWVPWKNLPAFIDMAALLRRTVPSAYFLVVGDDRFGEHGRYGLALRARAAELGLSDRLVFAGYQPEIGRVLASLDVLVHPSAREPLGRVILEAMAAGKPVVAVNACGPGEIIRSGLDGVLTEDATPAALAAGVERVLADPELAARLGAAARQRMRDDFDIRETVRKVESVYDALPSRRGVPCA